MKTTIFAVVLATVLLTVNSKKINAQTTPPPKQWDKRFGGTDEDKLYSVYQTKDKGYILGGYSQSGIGGDKTEDNRGVYADFWIVKIDSAGKKIWDKRFGSSDDDKLLSMQQTNDGGYILGGTSSIGIGGDKTDARKGSIDYWVVKIDSNGIKKWDKTFGGTNLDLLTSIQQTRDSGYILGGYSWSDSNGDKSQKHRGFYDYWIVKINSNGIKEWDKTFGSSWSEQLTSIQETSDNGYILGGYGASLADGDVSEDSRGGEDYWIVKVDANGVKQWDKKYGGESTDELYSIKQTSDGGYILGGSSFSQISGDKTEDRIGGTDFWAVKIDANGVKQWDKTFGGKNSESINAIQQTSDGGYIFGGPSLSKAGGDKTDTSRGKNDYWVIKTDVNGIKQWDKTFGGSGDDYLTSLQQTIDTGFVFGGYSLSLKSGDKTENRRGDYDYWVVKLGLADLSISVSIKSNTSSTICSGTPVTFTAIITNGGSNPSYQWIRNNKNVGINSNTYKNNLLKNNDTVYCVVNSGVNTAISNKIGFTVKSTPSKLTISASKNTEGLCPKDSVLLTSSSLKNNIWSTGASTQTIVVTAEGSYTVTVSNANGCSASSDTTKVTYLTCAKPVKLKANNVKAKSVKLTWRKNNCATGYDVQYKIASSGSYTTVKTPDTSITIKNLTASTTYNWRVRSKCADSSKSVYTSGEDFTTLAGFAVAQIEEVDGILNNTFKASVYPNPATGNTMLTVQNTAKKLVVKVYDAQGKKIWQSNITTGTDILIPSQKFAAGIYSVVVTNFKEAARLSLLKE